MEDVGLFIWPFRLFYCYIGSIILIIWYISWLLGVFVHFLVFCTEKISQPWFNILEFDEMRYRRDSNLRN
jgi:hypothetical protein